MMQNANEIPSSYTLSHEKWNLHMEKITCSLTREIFLNTGRQISYLCAAMYYQLFDTQGFCLVQNCKILLAEGGNLWIDFI